MDIKRGAVFVHLSILDPDWKPGPGQKYADAPKAQCVITKVEEYAIYWQFADKDGKPAGGKHVISRPEFDRRYNS